MDDNNYRNFFFERYFSLAVL